MAKALPSSSRPPTGSGCKVAPITPAARRSQSFDERRAQRPARLSLLRWQRRFQAAGAGDVRDHDLLPEGCAHVSPMMRAITSVGPPTAKGTIMGRVGQLDCAAALAANPIATIKVSPLVIADLAS